MQSLSGVAGTLARATGEPRFVPMVMSDHTSGLIAAQCIGFALFRREKTGRGEAIDVPMLENMASFVSSEHMGAMTFDPPVGPSGDGRLLTPDYRPLPTKDGYITVGPNTNQQAFAFFDAIGRPELKTDPRFDNLSSRTANAAAYWEIRKAGPGPEDDGRTAGDLRRTRRTGGALQLDRRPAHRPAPRRRRLLPRARTIPAKAASAARGRPTAFPAAAATIDCRRRAGRAYASGAGGSGLRRGRDRCDEIVGRCALNNQAGPRASRPAHPLLGREPLARSCASSDRL